jgi:hypothetical protein
MNGVLVHSAPIAELSLFMGIAMANPGCVLSDVEFTPYATTAPAQFIATGNCIVNDTSVIKTGGVNGWDSSFYSIIGYPNCFITAKPSSLGNYDMFGFSTTPSVSPSYANGNFMWYSNGPNNVWQIHELGNLIGNFGPITLKDRASITYDGGFVRYYLNEVLQRTVAASGLTLYAFGSLYSPTGGYNSVEFGPGINVPLVDTGGLGTLAATEVASTTFASVNIPNGSTTQLAAVTLGPFLFDATIVLTSVTTFSVTSATNSSKYIITLRVSQFSTIVGQCSQTPIIPTSGTLAQISNTVEALYSLPAGTALQFVLQGFDATADTTRTLTATGLFKAEVIKR